MHLPSPLALPKHRWPQFSLARPPPPTAILHQRGSTTAPTAIDGLPGLDSTGRRWLAVVEIGAGRRRPDSALDAGRRKRLRHSQASKHTHTRAQPNDRHAKLLHVQTPPSRAARRAREVLAQNMPAAAAAAGVGRDTTLLASRRCARNGFARQAGAFGTAVRAGGGALCEHSKVLLFFSNEQASGGPRLCCSCSCQTRALYLTARAEPRSPAHAQLSRLNSKLGPQGSRRED